MIFQFIKYKSNRPRKGFELMAVGMFAFVISNVKANVNSYVTVEEARIEKAYKEIPAVSQVHFPLTQEFKEHLVSSRHSLQYLVEKFGNQLWQQAVLYLQNNKTYDDRSLYWARLQLAKELRISDRYRALRPKQQVELMAKLELASRGNSDVHYDTKAIKKIFITGFDPFFLDRNIAQSNPSGIAAMQLDNKIFDIGGQRVQIQAVVVPVRYADFDQGMIETIVEPQFRDIKVDMLATISMGRSDFDLERFPGLRRSTQAPDNLNVYTGANSKRPLPPFLHGVQLQSPEFVEFSLPVKQMKKAIGDYAINDRRDIQTLENGKFKAGSLIELQSQTSVNGSGGGYLSNEISYRTILLRDKLELTIPVGHIHTPRIKNWQQQEVIAIVDQIEAMLVKAGATL